MYFLEEDLILTFNIIISHNIPENLIEIPENLIENLMKVVRRYEDFVLQY